MARHQRTTRSLLLGATALAGALALSTGSAAAQQREYSFDLPAQPLDVALRTYARTAEQQVIFAGRDVLGRTSSPVTGNYSAEEALQIMLAGSDLTVQRTAEGVLQVARASDGPQSGSAAGGGAEVEALIVTAQKREEDIQDVPIAISAFTQEALETHQIAGGPDLMTQIPNFTFTKTNFSGYSIQIRGIGTQAISATTDAAVAVAFNNTPFIRNRFFEQEFYDLQRVEVLRGPQGTLYGRNATAGVVNIISAKPKFGYEAKLSADVANYNSTRLEGMINIPLAEDAVALRLAGAWTKRDGYATNEITGNPIDGRDLWSTRVSLRVTPNDRLDANLIWEHFEENDDRLRSGKQLCMQDDRTEIQGVPVFQIDPEHPGATYALIYNQGCLPSSLYSPDSFEAPNGFSLPYFRPLNQLGVPVAPINPYTSLVQSRDLRVIESTVDPEYWAKSDIVELQLNFNLSENLTLTSETGYNYDELFSKQDFNRFNTASGAFQNPGELVGDPNYRPDLLEEGPYGGIFCDPQIGCADRLVAIDVSRARSRQFSQEFRIGSGFDGPFNFSLGANFLRYDTEDKYYVFINTLTLYAAQSYGAGQSGIDTDRLPPWQPGVSDNHECLRKGRIYPDPTVGQRVNGCQYIDPNPIESLEDDGHNYFLSKNPYKLISYAVFGEAYYNVTEALKVTAGLRWTVDKKEAPRIPSWVLAAGTVGHPIAEVVEQEWREPTGRLTIDWKPDFVFTDETLLYASYAHGYKAGGSNPPVSGKTYWGEESADLIIAQSALKPKTFEAEFVDAFEIGTKNSLLDGRVTFNANVFYYDYEGYQISQIIDRSATNYNFDAKVWGAEIEADWRPLENLKLGFKGGYENTRIGDGEQAIDIMDRTAGTSGWVVARPFPSYSMNCVIPIYVGAAANGGILGDYPWFNSGAQGPCEYAYAFGWDPVTRAPYTAFPGGFGIPDTYPGFDPLAGAPGHPYTGQNAFNGVDYGPAPNNGEGFSKDLSGNELPNAPHFTATITADYTLPLPNDWLATLHTDLYYQSEAWTRVFNTEGFDKLKAYTNANLAAIFTNEEAGWKVMAYIKNVMDRDSITGAFLNSDDTGLTTNVFLTEPRLYGLRVTKTWDGGPWWTGANPNHPAGEPYPLTVELDGMLQTHDAPYDPIAPDWSEVIPDAIHPANIQNRDLDRGEGGEVKLRWRPEGGTWSVAGGFRFGKTKGVDRMDDRAVGDVGCYFASPYYNCDNPLYIAYAEDWLKATVTNHEEHKLVDFQVGKDFGLGGVKSTISAGLRYADFQSRTRLDSVGVPDWEVPDEWVFMKYSQHHYYDTDLTAEREFKGWGPTLNWDGSLKLLGSDEAGHLDADWSLSGGVLFGKQRNTLQGQETATYYDQKYRGGNRLPDQPAIPPTTTTISEQRSKSVTAPMAGASLGLSYDVQRVKIGAGYRWERYFDMLDAGYAEHRDADRTIDGPYFKIAVGFGG